jgi:hypothetical protein
MKNKIEDLRNHLFATLESLQDSDNPMPIDRAKAVAEVAQVLINSAKVEVDYLKATDQRTGSVFMAALSEQPEKPVVRIGRV